MANHPETSAKRLRKDSESYNGWTGYYSPCKPAVEKSVGGTGEQQLYPTITRRRRKRGAPFSPQEFWELVDRRGAAECWPWLGRTLARNGYGMFYHADLKQTLPAHRVAWLLTRGLIGPRLEVMHVVCDNPACQNPKHLTLGTHLDNMRDMQAKGRRSPDAHSPKGRPWSPEQRRKLVAARRARAARQIAAKQRKSA